MAKQHYFPRKEGKQLIWFNNLRSKIAAYYVALGISAANQIKLTLVLNWLIFAWGTLLPVRRQEGRAATTWRDELAYGDPDGDATPPPPAVLTPPAGTPFPGMLNWLFAQIAQWKKASGYTEPIGIDLDLIGPDKPTADPTVAPQVKAMIGAREVILTFQKDGHMGVWVEGQVGDETEWTFLAIDTTSPYNDTRPLQVAGVPEMRRYRVCFWDGNPTKVWCNVIEITFGG